MRKGKNDSNNYPIIKNIQLISPEDSFYKLYCSKFKSEKPTKVAQTSISTNRTAELASHALEDTVFEWIKKSGASIETRIIYFEKHFNQHKFIKLFKELDYVLKNGNKLIIGELKVSNHNPTGKALKQTYESRELLKNIYPSIEVQIIWIDLSPKYSQEKTSEFVSEFLKTKFVDLDCTGDKFKYKQKIKLLHIDAQDIFNWGVENKIIRTPEIILASIEESEFICKISQLKDSISKLKRSITENGENDEICKQIADYDKSIHIYKARLELFQKGWTIVKNTLKSDLFKLLDNESFFFLKTNHSPEFKTENQRVKFIVFQKTFQSKVQLLHAGKIYFYYHRVSLKEISEIENVFVCFDDDKYPLVNNKGRRKFCFDYSRIDINQINNSGLQEFKRIIENAEPLKILLNDDEFLIIDNHVMLYRL